MAALSNKLISIFFIISILGNTTILPVAEGNWCVARSDATNQALQTALDYACGTGADCSPIQSNGLCFLPNTIQAHASYAFDSYFQRKGMASGSCDFSGTATVARTDPSYGSCVYPSSLSTAGGATTSTTPTSTTNPNSPTPSTVTPANGGGTAGLNPGSGMTPPLPTDNSRASIGFMAATILIPISLLLVLSFTF
ncbi:PLASMODESMATA CALLOSE-BINDING PROTEIN 3 [Hevea brasiliensis]|uniref:PLASMODESMATA CALLOSE-BINDING PROTEIN 3 n=1 Tax=Hevea brasiliensis TaxID=3981 RepID=UPI0025F676EC|nr:PLASMODESMATA CALLOSE-BINDING PROTEIN 3 [Hevea brasiliensis]